MSGGSEKGRRRRAQILEATAELLSERGFEAVTMRAVAERAGLSLAGVLHHFSTRAELLAAVLHKRDERALRRLEGVAAERFFGVMRDVVAEAVQEPQFGRLHLQLAIEATDALHPARSFFAARYRALDHAGAAALGRLRDAEALPADLDLAAFADLLAVAMDGLQLRLLHDQDFNADAVIEVLARLAGTAIPRTDATGSVSAGDRDGVGDGTVDVGPPVGTTARRSPDGEDPPVRCDAGGQAVPRSSSTELTTRRRRRGSAR